MLDTPEFFRGRNAEAISAKWLQDRGWFVVPSYDYSGADGDKPPRLQGANERYAIPDLDVARDGTRMWVEVKLKAGPTFYRKTQTDEHGIDLRLWNDYVAVERITGTEVWLFILEENTSEIRGQSLRKLGTPRIHKGRWGRFAWKEMCFWPRDLFLKCGTFGKEER